VNAINAPENGRSAPVAIESNLTSTTPVMPCARCWIVRLIYQLVDRADPVYSASGVNNMNIEHWNLTKLIPYARNPRRNDGAVDRMAASIREFGFKIPILARSTGEIIDGHLRRGKESWYDRHDTPQNA
jgi:ParB-like nuclease domain